MSTSAIRLYSGPLSMFGAKVQIAAEEKGVELSVTTVPFDMTRLYEPKHPDVLRINPKKQVPVLVHGDLELFDSTQIFEYLEDLKPSPPLWPSSPPQRARARLLEHKSDEVYFPHIIRLMGLQEKQGDPAALSARGAASDYYRQMEGLLAGRDYLAGPYTFADIAFFMAQVFGDRMGAPITAGTPRLLAWRGRVADRGPVKRIVGQIAGYLSTVGRPVPVWMADAKDFS